jgi:hypothetical protein
VIRRVDWRLFGVKGEMVGLMNTIDPIIIRDNRSSVIDEGLNWMHE